MPWDADKHHLGFSTGTPWLPMAPEHRALAVSRQEEEALSTLKFARAFLALRKKYPALRWGEIVFRDAPGPLLIFERRLQNDRVLCVFNMSAEKTAYAPPQSARRIDVDGENDASTDGQLAPYGFRLFSL
jgi:alpha-glucosidase